MSIDKIERERSILREMLATICYGQGSLHCGVAMQRIVESIYRTAGFDYAALVIRAWGNDLD